MINKNIFKLASNTSNVGLKNVYTHKTSLTNSLCGDKITLELTTKKMKISSMKYVTESCIYCEASASLLSKKIKNLDIDEIKKNYPIFKKNIKKRKIKIPRKFNVFKKLFSSDNINRLNCLFLPFDAVFKALK